MTQHRALRILVYVNGHLERINIAIHCVKLLSPDTAQVPSTPYNAGPYTREFTMAKIDKMLAENTIEPAQTEWTAPIVIVPKKKKTPQFCSAYRKLNGVTKLGSYLVPQMGECIDSLGEAAACSALDANSMY